MPDRVERRRDEILSAAYVLFGERGYHDTNISDIAERLEIGHGTIYRYFKNKRSIFEEVVDMALTKLAMAAATESPEAASTLEDYKGQLSRLGEALFDLFTGDTRLARILFYEAPGIDRPMDDKLQQAMGLFAQNTEAFLRNGVARGFFKQDLDTPTCALALNAMTFEGVRRVVASEDQATAKETWIRSVRTIIVEGLRS